MRLTYTDNYIGIGRAVTPEAHSTLLVRFGTDKVIAHAFRSSSLRRYKNNGV